MRLTICLILLVMGLFIWAAFMGWPVGSSNGFGEGPGGRALDWWLMFAVGYIVMLAGAVLGGACRLMAERRVKGTTVVDIREVFRTTFGSIDFWLSMLASPIIYGMVANAGKDMSNAAFVFFALQTGFSSYAVVNTLLAGKGMDTGQHELAQQARSRESGIRS